MSLTACVCPSGDLVLARYTLDENWYRGRVLSIVTDDENPTSQKAEVFYVDYGNTEMMPLNRLVAIAILTPQIVHFFLTFQVCWFYIFLIVWVWISLKGFWVCLFYFSYEFHTEGSLLTNKGKFLYSAVSSPQDRSKRFSLYFSDTISTSLGSIQRQLQLMREGCSYTYPPGTHLYSCVNWNKSEKLAQGFNTTAQDLNLGPLSREFVVVSHCTLQRLP